MTCPKKHTLTKIIKLSSRMLIFMCTSDEENWVLNFKKENYIILKLHLIVAINADPSLYLGKYTTSAQIISLQNSYKLYLNRRTMKSVLNIWRQADTDQKISICTDRQCWWETWIYKGAVKYWNGNLLHCALLVLFLHSSLILYMC
jgi:hypothetical protein